MQVCVPFQPLTSLVSLEDTLPAGDPLWFLSAFFGTDGANNHANLSSDAIDGHLAELSLAEDKDERVALTTKAHNEILKEVAVSNLGETIRLICIIIHNCFG